MKITISKPTEFEAVYLKVDAGVRYWEDAEVNGVSDSENPPTIVEHEGYVPSIMCPEDEGYGDYIIMNIDKNGFIQGWRKNLISRIIQEEED